SAVAEAAMRAGVARQPIDVLEYREALERRLGRAYEVMRAMITKAQKQPKRIVFTEGEEGKILRPCQILLDERIAQPILIGREDVIRAGIAELHLDLAGAAIVEPAKFARIEEYTEEFYSLRQRKGITRTESARAVRTPVTFASLMVRLGDADAVIGGLATPYPRTIRPALEGVGGRPWGSKGPGGCGLMTREGEL